MITGYQIRKIDVHDIATKLEVAKITRKKLYNRYTYFDNLLITLPDVDHVLPDKILWTSPSHGMGHVNAYLRNFSTCIKEQEKPKINISEHPIPQKTWLKPVYTLSEVVNWATGFEASNTFSDESDSYVSWYIYHHLHLFSETRDLTYLEVVREVVEEHRSYYGDRLFTIEKQIRYLFKKCRVIFFDNSIRLKKIIRKHRKTLERDTDEEADKIGMNRHIFFNLKHLQHGRIIKRNYRRQIKLSYQLT